MKRLSRRALLGGSLALVASGGLLHRAHRQGLWLEGEALRPWRDFDPEDRDPLALVGAAILAASPHNIQPWRFALDEGRIDLHVDRARSLGAMDPFDRERSIGLGCALENLLLAAEARGWTPHCALLPEGDASSLVARVQLSPQQRPGSTRRRGWHAAIPSRHTQRGPYDTARDVTAEERLLAEVPLETGVRLALLPAGSAEAAAFAEATQRATEAIVADHEMLHASARWFRHNPREQEEHRDGPSIMVAGLPSWLRTLAILAPPSSAEDSHAHWVKATREVHCGTAAGFGILRVPRRLDRATSLRAGRSWQRLQLEGARLGLAMHPLNQIPEVVDRAEQLGTALPFSGIVEERAITFAFRYGQALDPSGASARRAVEDVLDGAARAVSRG